MAILCTRGLESFYPCGGAALKEFDVRTVYGQDFEEMVKGRMGRHRLARMANETAVSLSKHPTALKESG